MSFMTGGKMSFIGPAGEMKDNHFLTPSPRSSITPSSGRTPTGNFDLDYDAWGRLVLTDAEGRRHVGVEPVRGFPITDPGHGISILDAEGREILWLDSLNVLPAPTRRLLEEDLARREFVPHVLRIIKVSALVEPSEWELETDRGTTRLVLNSEDDVRRLGDHRALIIDNLGIRYLIPDTRSLDAASRRMLEKYL
jgi:hypothetical protein